jgi:hypothetical protein
VAILVVTYHHVVGTWDVSHASILGTATAAVQQQQQHHQQQHHQHIICQCVMINKLLASSTSKPEPTHTRSCLSQQHSMTVEARAPTAESPRVRADERLHHSRQSKSGCGKSPRHREAPLWQNWSCDVWPHSTRSRPEVDRLRPRGTGRAYRSRGPASRWAALGSSARHQTDRPVDDHAQSVQDEHRHRILGEAKRSTERQYWTHGHGGSTSGVDGGGVSTGRTGHCHRLAPGFASTSGGTADGQKV